MRPALYFLLFFSFCNIFLNGQDIVRYIGKQQSNINFHDGQLPHAMGVHNIQVMRANRQHPEMADGYGWTYNHNQNIAYWNGKFYVHYLSTPYAEHHQPGQTMLVTSKDGYNWGFPVVVFPPYELPIGYSKPGETNKVYPGMHSVMHQRMGFYVTKKNSLLTFGYYGISFGTGPGDNPNDGNGVGRVVREIYPDGSFGDIYFIRYNKGFSEKNTNFPFYTRSKDKGFVEACNEVLANKLIILQWWEESDRDDPLVSLHETSNEGVAGVNKAFNFYHLPDGRVVGLWKFARYSVSLDEGATWSPVKVMENVISGGNKYWGQQTSDGKYAYVSSEGGKRWPLAVMTSEDGFIYNNFACIQGEVSPERYIGAYKDYGTQYVRGIIEGNGTPPDGKMWLVYSMNKEDIWVSSVKIPLSSFESQNVNEEFNSMKIGEELNNWNIYSPVWATVKIEKDSEGVKNLVLRDKDRYDFAKAERLFKTGKNINVRFTLKPLQADGLLHAEIHDRKGEAAITLIFDEKGNLKVSNKQGMAHLTKYESGKSYDIELDINTEGFFNISVNGDKRKDLRLSSFYLEPIERIVFRTGPVRTYPDASPDDLTMSGPEFRDLPLAGEPDNEVSFFIKSLQVESK